MLPFMLLQRLSSSA